MDIKFVDSSVLPTGEYVAEVAEITEGTGDFGPQFKWTFNVLDGDGSVRKSLFSWTSTSRSVKGKFAKWTAACLGRTLGPGDAIKTSDLIGTKVVVVVVVNEGKDGGEFNKVDAVKPYRKATPSGSDGDGGNFGQE